MRSSRPLRRSFAGRPWIGPDRLPHPSLPLTERLVALLDEQVGAINRLLARSPHAAELIESKQALAAAVFADFHAKGREMLAALLRDGGIRRSDAPEMFLAAAYGALRIGDLSKEAYRARLAALVAALVSGIGKEPG